MAVGDYFDPKGSGKCGDDLQWELYENGQLLILGQGDMYDYSESDYPWYTDSEVIADVEIREGVTGIGTWAFSCLKKLKKLSIPQSVSHIGKNAFRNTFDKQCDPVCYVPEGFSYAICDKYNEGLFSAIYYTKIVAFFSQCLLDAGYEEPVYHTVKFGAHEEYPSTFATHFYDEQGIIRKEYILGYHHCLESIEAHDENGAWQGGMVIRVSTDMPAFTLRMYLPTSNAQYPNNVMDIDFTLSLIDFEIRKKP